VTENKLHILLIEDNPGDARLIKEMLSESTLQYSVGHSQTLSDGLEKLNSTHFDAIFLDFNLPDCEGLDSIPRIKKAAPKTPIVMLTGLDDENTAVCALRTGAQDYLVKGKIDIDALARSLRYSIERKRAEGEIETYNKRLEILVHERTKELVSANEEIQTANELLENIFSNVHVLLAYMDTDFNFIRVNNRYAEADGHVPEFFIGKNHFALYPNEENEAIFRKVAETGETFFVRAKPFRYAEHPERGTTFRDWSLRAVKDEYGKVSGLVLSLIDVTQNIMLYEELLRTDHLASIGKLAAGVAHEINNPINGVINYAQILLNRCDTESKEHEIAGRIIKESDRIAGIVSNLLTFARDKKEAKRPTDLKAVLSDSLALMETQLRKNGARLNVHLPDDLREVVANHQQIQQVFLNVISNASYALNRKYPSAHEDKVLEITGMRTELEDKPYVRMIFHDHGSGIPAGILDRIMAPFFTTKSGDDGTGLGLSICHGIINDHEGKIRVESVEGAFTRIIIDLPAL